MKKMLKTPYGFIPDKLRITGRPELEIFPNKIVFMSYRKLQEKLQSGSAIYEPDLESHKVKENLRSLTYRNTYGKQAYIVVNHDIKTKVYHGMKYVRDEAISQAFGTTWKDFFVNLTMAGLGNGEPCLFEDAQQDRSFEERNSR
jgi:hypothetical protein